MFRANNFDKLLDKATSNLRLDPDWPTILQICDLIRQNDCTPKYAVAAIKKKLYSQNPHQAMFALLTLESVVKNCGSGIHDEVASKGFCEMLRDLVKSTQHENLRNKILELVQAWAFAFRNNPKYRAVQDIVNILKAEGYKFPSLKESDAMFSADTAPEWADGEVCHRCRVAFTLVVRRHHCRACGQVFCQQCSSKTSTLPKFGIEKEVRVCDACYDKVSRPPPASTKLEIVDTSNDYGPTQPQKRPGKSAEELQEEEEFQLALALSQSEAEQKEKERRTRSHIAPAASLHPTISPTPSSVSASPEHSGATNTELSRYLDRGYWEQRVARDSTPAAPTAPTSHSSNSPSVDYSKATSSKDQDDEDAKDKEIDEFVSTLKSQIEIFVNRMKSNSSRGRSIANDTSVQSLFMNITTMHSQLLHYIQQQDDKRVYLESLQDKISQIRDARCALDTLRAEHAARVAALAEAAERARQLQMAAKLHAMRKKKHDYLQYQRQLALQRVQEQEREMQMRQEQQKHQYMMSASSGYYMPGVSMHQFQPGYGSQPIYANPQYHPQMMPQATTDASVSMPGQPQMTQANMPMGVNTMAPVSQSMPQITQPYGIATTSGPTVSQAPINTQQSMAQPNIRQPLGPTISMPPQMMMQQMHQMRLPNQPGAHSMLPPNMPNGFNSQNITQQNGQINQQIPKQNQPQQGPSMMPPMIGQPNIGQAHLNPNNPVIGMQMQNVRMQMMQGNQQGQPNQQIPVSGYSIPNQQINSQMPNMQQQQMHSQGHTMTMPGQQMLPGQPIPGTGQMPGVPQQLPGQNKNIPLQNHIPMNNQNVQPQAPQMQQPQVQQPHLAQGQQMTLQNQPMQPPGPQMNMPMMQGQNMQQPQAQQNIPQGNQQTISQPQQIGPNQMQPSGPPGLQMQQQFAQQAPQQLPNQGQAMQGQQMPQVGQGPQMHMQMSQAQNMPQNVQHGQQMKIPPQNFQNAAPGQPMQNQQQTQQPQTSVKSEHNNNTAELISFD